MLEAMGAETEAPARMRKGELIVWTGDQARTRSWAPACLSWGLAPNDASDGADVRDAPDADVGERPDEGEAGGEAEGDHRTAGSKGADDEADLGLGVFVVTPAGKAALAGAAPVDAAPFEAVPDDAAV